MKRDFKTHHLVSSNIQGLPLIHVTDVQLNTTQLANITIDHKYI